MLVENVEKFIKQAKSYDYEVQAPKTTRLKHFLRTLLFLYYGPAKLARLGVNTEGGENLPPLGNLPFIKSDSELENTIMEHNKTWLN